MSIAGYAPAPYPLNGARRGDVRQRVTGHQDQVRALPGGDTSSVGEAEHSCRFSRGSGQSLRRADAAPDKEFELSVQACSERGPRVRGIRARQQNGAAIDEWLSNFLASPEGANKLGKLGASDAAERHLVIVLDLFSQAGMGISMSLLDQQEEGAAEDAIPADQRVVDTHRGDVGMARLDRQ